MLTTGKVTAISAVVITAMASMVACTSDAGPGPITSSATQSAASHELMLTVFEDADGGTFAFLDNPPKSPAPNPESSTARFSMGDQAYWSDVLRDHKGGHRIGTVYGAETVMTSSKFPRVTNSIHAVFVLAGGQLIVDSVVDESVSHQPPAAVVGGTGIYAGARGTLAIIQGDAGNTETFTILMR